MEEEQFEEDDEIHGMEDKGSATFLTKAAYENSLFNDQISQEWDGEAVLQTKNHYQYNQRYMMNNVKETPLHKVVVIVDQQDNKWKKSIVDPNILKAPAIEVRGLDSSPSSFSFQSEIEMPRIPMPLIEAVKNESFKKFIVEALEAKTIQDSTNYVNLRDDQPAVILSPMIENCEDIFLSFYVSLFIYDRIL